MGLRICYHGTDERGAVSILREGFDEGTYFALHLEDALGYGGTHVFGVTFDEKKLPPNWQFTSRGQIPPTSIVHYHIYWVRRVSSNRRLQQKVFRSNLSLESNCHDGEGQDYWDTEETEAVCAFVPGRKKRKEK